MNVTSLRQELEKLERAGYGHCRLEVHPTSCDYDAAGTLTLDFTATDYGVSDVFVPGWPDEGFVTLIFDTVGKPGGKR